jgi:hypothetical protein
MSAARSPDTIAGMLRDIEIMLARLKLKLSAGSRFCN